MKELVEDKIYNLFLKQFGKPTVRIFAPGRANIIGEHTDYNSGYVMPFAIDLGIWFFAAPNDKNYIHITSFDFSQTSKIPLYKDYETIYPWETFFVKVIEEINQLGISGANIVFGGNLPIGAGISSSSAITCGFLSTMVRLNQIDLKAEELINFAVNAETAYGVRGGMMDQFTIFKGIENHTILLDCKTNTYEQLPLQFGNKHFYLINTNVKHNLIDTDYNNRRKECEIALEKIQFFNHIDCLSSLKISELMNLMPILDPLLFKRVKFIVEENARVLEAKEAILNSDFKKLGELMYLSHRGLADLYEVSSDELDWLVNYTHDNEAFLGSRMMGGGFGGCTINLLNHPLDEQTTQNLKSSYHDSFDIFPDIIPVSPKNGIINQFQQ